MKHLAILILLGLMSIGCNASDSHYWNWGSKREYSFCYTGYDASRGEDPERFDASDFIGAGQRTYSLRDNPGLFYRSLGIPAGTRVKAAVFPPDDSEPRILARGVADEAAYYDFSSTYSNTGRTDHLNMQMVCFWIDDVDWKGMVQRHGYGQYSVGWYWNDETKASALHRFEMTP